MIHGVNRRLVPQDAPGWCDGPVSERVRNYALFFHQMDFLWRIHLDPSLPFRLMPRVRENGQDGGVQAICRFDCTWDVMYSSMVGLLEQVSEQAWIFLRQNGHSSLIEIEDQASRQDHRAILYEPMKFWTIVARPMSGSVMRYSKLFPRRF